MPTFIGTITMVPLVMVPEPWRMDTTDPNMPVIYLRIGSANLPIASMVAGTGRQVIVDGDGPFNASFNLPLLEVRSIRLAPPPQPQAPPAAAPAPPPPVAAAPPLTGTVTLIGRIRRPPLVVRGVTHALIDSQNRTWLLRATGENREELDDILEDFLEEGDDELARVTGIVELQVMGLSVVRVTSADEADDDDDDNGNNGWFSSVANGAPQPSQVGQLMALAMALSRTLAARGVSLSPAQVLQLLILRLRGQRFGML